MYEAMYVNADEKKIINAKHMNIWSYRSIYKGNLYCPNLRCSAQMVYVNEPSRYFRTLQNSKHVAGCPYAGKVRVNYVRRKRSSSTNNGKPRKDHINNVLNDLYKIVTTNRRSSYSYSKNKTNTSVNIKQEEFASNFNLGTEVLSQNNNLLAANEKDKSIPKKSISQFLLSAPNETYAVAGTVLDIDIKDKQGWIKIIDDKNILVLHVGQKFIDDYPQGFEYLECFKHYFAEDKKPIICACVCDLKKQDGNIAGEIESYDNLRFDNEMIGEKLCSVSRFAMV